MLFLAALNNRVLGLLGVVVGARPDSLDCCNYFLVFRVWLGLLEWILISYLVLAYL